MPSSFYIPLLLAGMLLTGTSNSIWSKYQDLQCVENCNSTQPVLYEQPVWQTLQMFLGEMLCFLPVLYSWIQSRRQSSIQLPEDDSAPNKQSPEQLAGWKILLLWIPAACDLTGTTLMNVGLLYTPVSIYQMSRGALVLFVGVLSVTFLRRRLWLYQWISLLVVMAGVALVGFSGSLIKDAVKEATLLIFSEGGQPEVTQVVIGVFFILFAQIFTAAQFSHVNSCAGRYAVEPLVAVGWEGFFGALTILLFMPILSIPAVTKLSPFFDLSRGWTQMIETPTVLYSGIVIAFSIAFFNFFGLSVTRSVSSTVRSLVDTCRTLLIWIISLGLGWEHLAWLSIFQVLGFTLLVYGTFMFNNLVTLPKFIRPPVIIADEEAEGLLAPALDETANLPADVGQSGFDVLPPGEHALAQAKPASQSA
ncbi:hypothetical protein FB45DRAFT_1057537 [Roridomyces roridus]|uniref:Integral membrane protein n=1 Tax=Roridomyces roridus TaxID=1738132 RepID=A0AAD7FQD6_9AGAR|nr:hypothetical protein FB45DRAFT_1057537 [Roridomyces roridus]